MNLTIIGFISGAAVVLAITALIFFWKQVKKKAGAKQNDNDVYTLNDAHHVWRKIRD